MNHVLDKAKDLGLALCQSQEYARMHTAQMALESDEPLCRCLAEFQNKQTELMELLQKEEGSDRLLVAALSRDVESLQAQLLDNPIFSAAVDAQNSFSELMEAVNREIATCIGISSESNASCGGSCGGCSGCGH